MQEWFAKEMFERVNSIMALVKSAKVSAGATNNNNTSSKPRGSNSHRGKGGSFEWSHLNQKCWMTTQDSGDFWLNEDPVF